MDLALLPWSVTNYDGEAMAFSTCSWLYADTFCCSRTSPVYLLPLGGFYPKIAVDAGLGSQPQQGNKAAEGEQQ